MAAPPASCPWSGIPLELASLALRRLSSHADRARFGGGGLARLLVATRRYRADEEGRRREGKGNPFIFFCETTLSDRQSDTCCSWR